MTFEGITLPNCVFIWLLLALPAAACCSERDAVISFWIMLPAALIYGPAGGFRLAESSPLFCLPFRQLATGVLTVAWVVYPVATWLSLEVCGSGLSGGIGLLASYFASYLYVSHVRQLYSVPKAAMSPD